LAETPLRKMKEQGAAEEVEEPSFDRAALRD
jgi:hypothetical protein